MMMGTAALLILALLFWVWRLHRANRELRQRLETSAENTARLEIRVRQLMSLRRRLRDRSQLVEFLIDRIRTMQAEILRWEAGLAGGTDSASGQSGPQLAVRGTSAVEPAAMATGLDLGPTEDAYG